MNTNQTNGSPFEDAAEKSRLDPIESLSFPHVSSRDLTDGISAETDQPLVPHPVAAIPPIRPGLDDESAGDVDEMIDMQSRDRGAVEFRVTCSGSPVRRLRLTGNRYTFGSAEGCSIRLSDETLRPMHAVLLRDASRVIVRAYSVPVQVNTSRTNEAHLRAGDVLRLGQFQFELLWVKSAENKSSSGGFCGSPADSHSGEPENAGDDRRNSNMTELFAQSNKGGLEPQRGGLSGLGSEDSRTVVPDAGDTRWRDRLRQEVDQWRERQQELLALRDEDHPGEEYDHTREVELHEQELQYRSQLEEATWRLHQSQQKAESAAELVAQMREQFEFLNAQIEQLSQQHLDSEAREQEYRVEHEQLRAGLEQARDQAVQDHADSEMRRMAAEEKVAKLEEQVAKLRASYGASESEQQTQLSESEVAESLRHQVEELQQMVSDARNEAEVLRADHQQACSSVRELENIVSESEGWGEENREQLIAETCELRSALEKISSELDQANSELKQLRKANEDLTRCLTEVKQERERSCLDGESSPSHEEVESLRIQLDSANERIETMQLDHQQTLVRLEAAEQQNDYRQLSNEPNANEADAVWEEVGNVESDHATHESVQETTGQKLGCQKVRGSESNDKVDSNQHITPDAENLDIGAADDLAGCHEFCGDDFLSDKAAADTAFMEGDEKCGAVEAYINRLLKHVRGDAGGKTSEDEPSDEAHALQEQKIEPLDSNAPDVPSLLVPEADTDLNAMHELAHVSARVASKCRTPLRARNIQVKGVIRLVYALGAIGCGAVCFVLFTGIPTYVISVMAGVVAAIYVREAMQLFQEANYQYSAAMSGLQDEVNIDVGDDQSADV